MRIVVACDHGGFTLKSFVKQVVLSAGHDVIDAGTDSSESVDFPDFTQKAGQMIQSGEAERGIILCGSGVGACIAANKMNGIYAGVCHDTYSSMII
jgi:ribose 5-phosphate isomerase B